MFNNINLDYDLQTGNDGKWLFSGLYEFSLLSHDIDNPNISFNPGSKTLGNTLSHYMQYDETPLHAYRISAEYQKVLSNGFSLSMGLQPQYVIISGSFDYDTLNVASNLWGAYSSLENTSELRRGIYAAYVDGAGQWNNLQFKIGLRVEHTDQGLSIDNPEYFNLFERPVLERYLVQKTDFFPSLHVLYKISETDNLAFAASRRISRSPVKNMFPFLYRRHLEVYVVGDPALKPEYIQTAELSYRKNVADQQFSLTGFYRGVSNAVFRVNTVYPDELVLIRSFTNAGETISAGGELSANLEWDNRVKFFFGASLYHFQVQADIFGYREDNQSVNWNLKGNGNILLGRQFRLSADFDIRSAEITAQGRNELLFMTNAALSYTHPKYNAWVVNLRLLNILNTNNRVLSTRAYNKEGVQIFYQDTDFYYYGPVAEFMVTYSLNRISKAQPRVRTGIGGSEF
jgi:outer membrane receptor protein involved in Fe transport